MPRPRPLPILALLFAATLAIILQPWSRTPPEPAAPAVSPRQAATPPPAAAPVPAPAAAAGIGQPDFVIVDQQEPAASPAAQTLLAGRGRVLDPAGNGLGGIRIEVVSKTPDDGEKSSHETTTDDGGGFVIENLQAGRGYRLAVEPVGNYAARTIDPFTVEESIPPAIIVLQPVELVDADGMIVDTNQAPIADFELNVRSLAAEFPDRTIRSDATGYFRLEGFPAGELRIATNASDYYRIKGLELSAHAYQNLTVMLDRGNYHLAGWVTDENGLPVDEAQITLKSAFEANGYHSFSYRTAVTDTNGGFEFSDLGGHRMTLGVYARGYQSHIRQHAFQSFSDTVEIRLER